MLCQGALHTRGYSYKRAILSHIYSYYDIEINIEAMQTYHCNTSWRYIW